MECISAFKRLFSRKFSFLEAINYIQGYVQFSTHCVWGKYEKTN